MSDFISMLVTSTLYSIIRVDYDVFVASEVTTSIIQVVYDVFVASWGDDLAVDMVPHVSRVGLGALHV